MSLLTSAATIKLGGSHPVWRILALALCLLGAGLVHAQDAAKSAGVSAEEPVDFRNWLNIGVGSTFVNGDKAAFTRRHSMRKGAFGGIEDFHWEQDVGKRGLFKIDGRGIFDNHDYSIRLELSHPDKGFVRAGYTEFRTWYDGSGGFFPPNGRSFSLYNKELAMDRGSAWFEAGLRLENVPEITFRYEHVFRRGQKESLVWGDTTLTGGLGARGIVPSFYDIDESREIFSLDAKHTVRLTDLGLGLRYEISDQMNSRNLRRSPTQAADRHVTQRDGYTADFFNVHAWTESRFSDEVLFTTGYSFTKMDSDLSGSRIYGPGYDPVYDPLFARRQFRDEGYFALSGGSQMHQHVAMLNLHLTPWDDWSFTPAIRVERQELNNASSFVETAVGAGPAFTTAEDRIAAQSQRGTLDVSESLDVRYTGITNWVFYTRANWMQGEGDLNERETLVTTGVSDLLRDSDFRRSTQKYEAGVNWYPLRRLNLAAQYYHKIRTEDYVHRDDSTANRSGNRYPAFLRAHSFDTDDVNFRVTMRPWNNLTLVSRYDFQLSAINMSGDGLVEVQSAEVTSHILSQSVSWAPLARLYFQASGSYAYDQTEIPNAGPPTSNLVPNPHNGYWNASALAGFAIDNKTDLQAQYHFYKASNFQNNSTFSQPYGASSEEHGVTTSLTRQLRKDLRLTLKYGFFRNRDKTSGGLNNYNAHLVASTLQYQF